MTAPGEDPKDPGYGRVLRSLGPLLGSGIQLAASVLLMLLIGRWLDAQWGTSPWLMLAGIVVGFGAGLYNFIRIASSVEKNNSDGRNDR